MGLRGPLPNPNAVGHGRGARRKDERALVAVPDAPAGLVPAPPEGLSEKAIAHWDRFWASPIARAVDRSADAGRLERWIRAWDEYYTVLPVFQKRRVVRGSQGQPVLSPLGTYLKDLEAVIAAAEKEFGMTPSSRARLGLTEGQARLTAAQLNAMLNQKGPDDAGADIDGEWEEA